MKKSTPRASKRIKESPDVRYEPEVSKIEAILGPNFKKHIYIYDNGCLCGSFPIGKLSAVIDALTRIEKQLYYQGLGLK